MWPEEKSWWETWRFSLFLYSIISSPLDPLDLFEVPFFDDSQIFQLHKSHEIVQTFGIGLITWTPSFCSPYNCPGDQDRWCDGFRCWWVMNAKTNGPTKATVTRSRVNKQAMQNEGPLSLAMWKNNIMEFGELFLLLKGEKDKGFDISNFLLAFSL